MTTSLRELPAAQPEGGDAVVARVAQELRAYNPLADEHKGQHIHKVWAKELEQALALSTPPAEGTPSSRWSANGEPDPHGDRYACERAALAMGDMTDDELANAVFLFGDTKPDMAEVIAGRAFLPSAYLLAAKDRIRWLSRKLDAAMIAATEGE